MLLLTNDSTGAVCGIEGEVINVEDAAVEEAGGAAEGGGALAAARAVEARVAEEEEVVRIEGN